MIIYVKNALAFNIWFKIFVTLFDILFSNHVIFISILIFPWGTRQFIIWYVSFMNNKLA